MKNSLLRQIAQFRYIYGSAEDGYTSAIAGLSFFVNLSGTMYIGSTGYVALWEWDGSTITEVAPPLNTLVDFGDKATMNDMVLYNSKIYMSYTYTPDGGATSEKFFEWNGTDDWIEKTAPPAKIKKFAVLNGKLYAIFQNDMQLREWNEGGDTWDFVADSNGKTFGHGFTVLGNNLYATRWGVDTAELYEWTSPSSTWTKVADDYGDLVNVVEQLLVFDGYILGCTTNDGVLLKWDGIDAWDAVALHVSNYDPEVPHYDMESLKALAGHNGKVYCIGEGDGYLLRWGGN